MPDRIKLPDFPRLMSARFAAAFLGVSVSTFRKMGIAPVNIGKRVLWDRRSLDLYADRLRGAPISGPDLELARSDVEAAFLERRRG